MKRIAFAITSALLLCCSVFAADPASPPPFTLPITYNYMNIGYPNARLDVLRGINNTGYMVGYHSVPSGGFTLPPSASCPPTCAFKVENYPGSTVTEVLGINNDNSPNFESAGGWADKTGNSHGFMHNSNSWVDVDFPGTTRNVLFGLNDNNVAAGYYLDGIGMAHAYTYSQPGNQFTPLFIPGSDNTLATGINDFNVIVGTYQDSSGTHGFELNPSFTAINYPGATSTQVTGINNAGAIVGFFNNGSTHGFIYYQGIWQQIDDPGATETMVWGINDNFFLVGAGDIVGFEATPN